MIAVELSPWKAPENAASTLHGLVSAIGARTEGVEGVKLTEAPVILRRDCAALQEHGA